MNVFPVMFDQLNALFRIINYVLQKKKKKKLVYDAEYWQ